MSNNFIENFLSSFSNTSGPGLIHIHHDLESIDVTGILANEISVSAQTTYGSVIPDISTLAELASIAGFASLPTWIGASALMWRGTSPIVFGAEMYLVNYSPDLHYEEDLKKLTKLCTLAQNDKFDKFTAKVHGGYSTDPTANNTQYFQSVSKSYQLLSEAKDEQSRSGAIAGVNKVFSKFTQDAALNITGTLTVSVGSKFKLGNLLLTKIDVTPSLVEVAEGTGTNVKPLYYRVGMSFTTCRAGLEGDIDGMFGG